MKIGELICPNINRTLVKLINCTFLLYTQNLYDEFIVDYDDYDDTTDEIIRPYANRVSYFGVAVPQSVTPLVTDPNSATNGEYLLLNSEFQNDTRLLGFEIFGRSAGLIIIKVKFCPRNYTYLLIMKIFLFY